MFYTTDAARWRALATRDANANGHFVYLVKSTYIYCRPTCPGRLARRANVEFVRTPAEAEAAGFRACKRCKPESETHEDSQERAAAKACKLIEETLKGDNPKSLRLQDLAKSVGLTPRYFHKVFKDKTGMTPKEYAKSKTRSHDSTDTSVPDSGQTGYELFNLDMFDVNDPVNFNLDVGLPLGDNITHGGVEQTDVNIQPQPWNSIGGPDDQDLGLMIASDKLDLLFGTALTSASPGWMDATTVSPVSSTLELDAAMLLGSDGFDEGVSDSNINYFNTLV